MLLKKRDLQLIASTDLTCIKNGINLHDAVESAITGGASTILMRDDTLSEEEYLKESARIKILCGMYDVPFLIFENVAVAEAMDADGIVVKLENFNTKEIRRKFSMDRTAGVLASTKKEALKAADEGASFIMFGPVTATIDKKAELVKAKELLDVCAEVKIPVVAYGGIADIDLNELRGTGICGFCVGEGIFGSEDITEAAGRLRNLAIDVL